MDSKGEAIFEGGVNLILNPPPAAKVGVAYGGCWVRVEADDEGAFTVRLFGTASYGNRSLTEHVDLDDPGLAPLKAAIGQVINAYSEQIKFLTLQSAYAARHYAVTHGEMKEDA